MVESKKTETENEETNKLTSNTKAKKAYLEGLLEPLIKKFSKRGDDGSLLKGLENLNKIAKFSPDLPPVRGTDFSEGVIGFTRSGRGLALTIACGKSMVRYIPMKKLIAMIEKMDDPVSATIVLETFTFKDMDKEARGQLLARINPESSAISIVQGVTGRVVRDARDIALFDNYYIDRSDLTAFYLAAKAQISNEDTLDEMIQAYEGWKAFEIPFNPSNPINE